MEADDHDPSYDRAVEQFGGDELVAAYGYPDRVRRLVDAGHVITPNAVLASCYTGSAHTLDILLSSRTDLDANVRLATATAVVNSEIDSDWAASDLTPDVGFDKREWYPLLWAASGPLHVINGSAGKDASTSVASILLRHKPDLFALFRQPLRPTDPFPFPGVKGIDDFLTYDSDGESDFGDTVEPLGQDKSIPKRGYGLRSLLHSLFEDGAYIRPILEYPDLDLNLEHRDPQGRTLLHSICRNAYGADAIIDAAIGDMYERARGQGKAIIAPEASETSLFHTLRKRGAVLTTVDYNGKNVLHHLLEARSPAPYRSRPPLIRNTLRYMLKHQRDLVNRPDRHGTYPLHTALQRLRGQIESTIWLDDSPLETIVYDILDAGADATARDSRGNTALHYLADNGLAEQHRGSEARVLCQRICDAGVDVNARNDLGQTALEILMDDSGTLHTALWTVHHFPEQRDPPSLEQIDREVFTMFAKLGARWTEQDRQGRTLLHLVAKYSTEKTAFRVRYLLDKGVDPALKDKEGRTVADVARASNNNAVLTILQDH